MIKVIAIDDEPLALRQLTTYIKRVNYLQLVAECQSAMEARGVLDQEEVDAIFCDINMPDLNGLDFVKSLAAPPLVVFTTAYADYALEGYKVNAVDYLLKPFGLDEFRRAANKLEMQVARVRALTAQVIRPTNTVSMTSATLTEKEAIGEMPTESVASGIDDLDARSLFVKSDGRIIKVNVDDIVYVEGMSEYLKIHLNTCDDNGRKVKPLVVLFSMKRMEEKLPKYFMRIHRSYIINLRKIEEVNKNRIIMDKDTFLPIGDLYREQFTAFLNRNFLGK